MVSRLARILGVAASLLGWVVASGLAWDGLQVLAWANMARLNSQSMSASAAIREALTGAPCKHCLSVREGRSESSKGAPIALGAKVAGDLALPELNLGLVHLLPRQRFEHPANQSASLLAREVPVPPPRASA
jgi:hypothetical protein